MEADLAANKSEEEGERSGHGGSDETRVVRFFNRPRKSGELFSRWQQEDD